MAYLVFLILFLAVGFLDNINAVDKISTQWVYITILNFFFLFYHHIVIKKPIRINFLKERILISYILFLIFCLISFFYTFNLVESIVVFQRFLIGLITIFSLCLIIDNLKSNAFLKISIVFSIYLFFEGFYILWIFVENYDFSNEFGRSQLQKGFAANINIAAFSISMKLPFIIYVFSEIKRKIILKICLIIIVSGCIFSMILTGSRGALLSLYSQIFLLFIYLLFTFKSKGFIVFKNIFLPLLASFMVAYFASEILLQTLSVSYRTEQIIEKGSKSRMRYYKGAFNSFLDKPLNGVGVGNWKIFSIEADKNDIEGYIVPYHAHNDFLQILAEIGILGFLSYFFIFIFSLLKILKNISADKRMIFVLMFFLVYAIDSNLNFPISRPMIQIILFSILAYLVIYKNNYGTTTTHK